MNLTIPRFRDLESVVPDALLNILPFQFNEEEIILSQ
jgi:hypothetical protein